MLLRQSELAVWFYSALPHHGSGRGTATVGGATGPAMSTVSESSRRHVSPLPRTMHGAAQAFGRARAIGAAKSVSFKKNDSVRFKINFEKKVKIKKILASYGTLTKVQEKMWLKF